MRATSLALLLVSAAVAQQDSGTWWKLGGPIGGLGYNVAYRPDSPSVFFVTDAWAGVHKSPDGGANWAASNTGITARAGASDDAVPVFSLAIDPNDNDIVWAGTQHGGGLFRSTDGGGTWRRRDSGIVLFPLPEDPGAGITVRNIAVQAGNSAVVYVTGEAPTGVRGAEFERTRGFVFKSTNGGASWNDLSPAGGFPNLTRWLFIDPDDPQRLFVTTGIFDREAVADDSGGAWRSTDGGASWHLAISGTSPERSRHFGGAARHPTDPRMLLIAAGNNVDSEVRGAHGAVYKSTDGGASWIDITPQLPPGVAYEVFAAVAFAPSNPQVIYAGTSETIYRSGDQGATWTAHRGAGQTPWGPPGVRSGVPIDMIVSPTDPNTLYVNNYGGGLFKSVDGGANWVSWSNGYTGADVRSVAVKPGTEGSEIAVNGRSGPFRNDGNGIWHGMGNGPVPWYPEGGGIAYDSHGPDGSAMLASDARSGVLFRSSDRGVSWTIRLNLEDSLAIGSPGNQHGVRSFAFARSTPGTVYAGFMAYGLETPHALDYPESFGIWRSTDAGRTWVPRNAGLPTGTRARNITDLAVSRQDPNRVYAALRDGGLYRTTDGGQSWLPAPGNLPAGQNWNDVWSVDDPVPRHSLLTVDVNPLNDSDVIVGSNMFGVYRSRDAGANWSLLLPAATLIPQGTRDHVQMVSVLFDPSDTARLYAADWHGGVYASRDGGSGWSQINSGLETRSVNRLAISDDGRYVYAATQGNGVFRYKAKNSTTAAARHPGTDHVTIRNIPGLRALNPVTGSFRVSYTLDRAGRVVIDVIDAHGRTVSRPFAGWRAAGLHHFLLDASVLGAGKYYLRLLDSGRTHVTGFEVGH